MHLSVTAAHVYIPGKPFHLGSGKSSGHRQLASNGGGKRARERGVVYLWGAEGWAGLFFQDSLWPWRREMPVCERVVKRSVFKFPEWSGPATAWRMWGEEEEMVMDRGGRERGREREALLVFLFLTGFNGLSQSHCHAADVSRVWAAVWRFPLDITNNH